MIILSILGYILLGIGILLIALIVIPYQYRVTGENIDESQINVFASWLFGGIKIVYRQRPKQTKEIILIILGISKHIHPKETSTIRHNEEKIKSRKNPNTLKRNNQSHLREYLRTDVIKKTLMVALKFFKHSQPKELFLNAKIGFSDPMHTGLMCAFTSQLYQLFEKFDLNIQPVFDEEIYEGRFLIGGRIWIAYLILVMIGFLITKPIRNILVSQLKRKIKGGIQFVR